MRAVLLTFTLLSCARLHAQAFTMSYGGDSTEVMGAMIHTPDGGYLLAGSTGSFTDFGFSPSHDRTGFVVKTNASGTIEWSFTLGDTLFVEFTGIALRDDGGYYVLGKTQFISSDDWRIVLAHVTPTGDVLWSKEIRTDPGIQLLPRRILAAGNDAYLIVGEIILSGAGTGFNSDQMAVKVDGDGVIQWVTRYGMNTVFEWSRATGAVHHADGGYSIIGDRNFSTALQLVRIDANGTYLWDRTYEDQIVHGDARMARTSDGIVVFGEHPSGTLLMKMNEAGVPLWQKVYTHQHHMSYPVFDIWDNGEMVFAATVQAQGLAAKPIIVHLDAQGEVLSATRYGPIDRSVWAVDIIANADGSITFGHTGQVGSTAHTDMVLVRMESDADGFWSPCVHEPAVVSVTALPTLSYSSIMTQNQIGNLQETAQTWVPTANGAAQPQCINVMLDAFAPEDDGPVLYPNPTTGSFVIEVPTAAAELVVTNVLGEVVLQRKLSTTKATLRVEHTGVYLVQVRTANATTTHRLVVDR